MRNRLAAVSKPPQAVGRRKRARGLVELSRIWNRGRPSHHQRRCARRSLRLADCCVGPRKACASLAGATLAAGLANGGFSATVAAGLAMMAGLANLPRSSSGKSLPAGASQCLGGVASPDAPPFFRACFPKHHCRLSSGQGPLEASRLPHQRCVPRTIPCLCESCARRMDGCQPILAATRSTSAS